VDRPEVVPSPSLLFPLRAKINEIGTTCPQNITIISLDTSSPFWQKTKDTATIGYLPNGYFF
jgi:hypothetical protein